MNAYLIIHVFCMFFYCAGSNDPTVIAMTSPTERKRQNAIQELITTEESYVKDMSIVLDVSP